MTTDPFAEHDEDPFALPLHDPVTGELLDDDEPALPARRAGTDVETVVAAIGIGADEPGFAAELTRALQKRVSEYAEVLSAQRPDGRLTDAAVSREVVALTSAYDKLSAIARAFAAAADLARDCLGEITLEVKGDRVEREGGSTSIRVSGNTLTGDVRVTVAQPTKVSVDVEAIIDVVAGQAADETADEAGAKGARIALDRWRSVTSPPTWKITALQQWVRDLERADDPAAVKLAAAFGRKPHGNLSTKIEHVDPKETTP